MRRICAARYLVCDPKRVIEDGALLLEGTRIAAVGNRDELRRNTAGAELVDFGEAVLLPAFVNAHTHLELTDFPAWAADAGAPEPDHGDFVAWVLRLIGIKRGRAAEAFAPSIRNGLRQLLASGTGAVGDILSLHDEDGVYADTPLLGTLFFETLGRDPQLTRPLLGRIAPHLEHPPAPHLEAGVSPHAPYTVAEDYLQRILDFSAGRCRASIHLAESPAEVELLRSGGGPFVERLYPPAGWQELVPAARGLSPVAWLDALGGLRPDVLLVHGVQVDAGDVALLKQRGVGVVLCPRSNEKLGVGRAPVDLYRRAGIPLALGTDSLASNDSLSLWDELAAASRLYSGGLSPEDLLHAATGGGAVLLGLDGLMGSLEAGKGANFQVVEVPDGARPETLVEALVCDGSRRPVRQLFLHGVGRL